MSREHEGKRYDVIMGRLKGETTMTEQAFRYPKEMWEPDEAHSHCQSHDGTFEAAADEEEALEGQEARDLELALLDGYQRGLSPAPLLYRGLADGYRQETAGEFDGLLQFVASEETEDRLGTVIRAAGWDLNNFRKNPVFMYVHDQTFPPLGVVSKVEVSGKQLLAVVRFDDKDEFAALIHRKYSEGFMRGVSVGFRALEFEEQERDAKAGGNTQSPLVIFTKTELVELSAVPVPAHPYTLKKALGQRSRFWVPFAPEVNVKVDYAPLQTSLETLNRSITEVLAKLILPPVVEEAATLQPEENWNAILEEVKQITKQGGAK